MRQYRYTKDLSTNSIVIVTLLLYFFRDVSILIENFDEDLFQMAVETILKMWVSKPRGIFQYKSLKFS